MSPEGEYPVGDHGLFSNSIYEEQTLLAERELSAFIVAVTGLFGSEQARASTEDWLDESELMDDQSRSEARNWRAVTIAAAARLANRVNDKAASAYAPHIYDPVIRYSDTD